MTIISANASPQDASLLYRWFDAHWFGDEETEENGNGKDRFDRPEVWISKGQVPDTLLAMSDGKLIGGLAFCQFPKPGSSHQGVWINGLLVLPEYRRKGVGSQLVTSAETAMKKSGFQELFVYSHMPDLYQKLGWQVVSIDEDATVLKKLFFA